MSNSYKVGYKKPPDQHKFKPNNKFGQGRKKGVRNFNGILKQELEASITIIEDGKKRKVSKQYAIVKQIIAKALKGDEKVFARLVPLMLALDQADALSEVAETLSDVDRAILKRNAKKLLLSLQDDGE